MKYKIFKLYVLFIIIFGFENIHAQVSVNSSGGEGFGDGGTVSYSVGQVFISTQSGLNYYVSQGVQQPYEISMISSIEENNQIVISLSVFPNPTSDFLTLEIEDPNLYNIYFQIFDMNGKLIQKDKVTEKQTNILVSDLRPAVYFLNVVLINQENSLQNNKTFKIIKN